MRLAYLFILIISPFGNLFSQCLDDDLIMFPPKSIDLFTGFGRQVVIQDDYLITSSDSNDSLAYANGLVFVYEYKANRWTKIAELTPSDPSNGMRFGQRIEANKNIIAISGTKYSPEGVAYQKVYVFEKDSVESWVTQNESYVIDPVPVVAEDDFWGTRVNFDVSDKFLALYYSYGYYFEDHHEVKCNIYSLGDDFAELIHAYDGLKYDDGNYQTQVHLNLEDDFLVISSGFYSRPNYSSGISIVYNYDSVAGWEELSHELIPPLENQIGFGTSVDVVDDNIFVSSLRDDSPEGTGTSKVFVYQKEEDKWTETNQCVIYSTPAVGSTNDNISASSKYLIHSQPAERIMSVFSLDDTLKAKEKPDFFLQLPDLERGYGWEMDINSKHFVYNSNDFGYSNYTTTGSEVNTVLLETPLDSSRSIPDQVLTQYSNTASGDEFASSSAFYKSVGAVGTHLDDDRGSSSGAVNIYERENEGLTWKQVSKIYSPTIQSNQGFGLAVDVNEKQLFVSAPFYDSLAIDGSRVVSAMGKVFQFEKRNEKWHLINEIISPDALNYLNNQASADKHKKAENEGVFFQNLSEGNVLIASDPEVESEQTGVSVLSQNDSYSNREFGRTLTYHNGYLAVGQRYFGGSNYKGSIYIFKENHTGGWDHQATLQSSDRYTRDAIGMLPIFMNDTLIIAGSAIYGNKALLFKRNPGEEWRSGNETATLLPDREELDGNYPVEEFDNFGVDIDLHGEYIIVGAPFGERDERLGAHSGRAYLFKMPVGGWNGDINHTSILKPKDRIVDGMFGNSVYIDSKNILVGAPHSFFRRRYTDAYNKEDEEPGLVYVFDRAFIDESEEVVNEVGRIIPDDGEALDGFGASISKNFLEVVVNAPLADTDNGDRSGAAYMYKKVGSIEEDIPPMCIESGSVDLIAYPVSGGIWSGEGIIDSEKGIFDPSALDEKSYSIRYQYGECTSTTTIDVYTKPVIINASNPLQYLCLDDSVDIFIESDKTSHDYQWFFKNTIDDEYVQQFIWNGENRIVAKAPGYYYGISLNPACNSEPEFFQVVAVDESTELSHEDYVAYCTGETFTLQLNSETQMDSYSWYYSEDTSNLSFIEFSSNDSIQVASGGLYFCQFIRHGCVFDSDTVNVQFDISKSELNYQNEYELCMGESIELSISNDYEDMIEFQWYADLDGFEDYKLYSDDQIITANQEGSFYCRSISSSGCQYLSDTISINQEVFDLTFEPIENICDVSEKVDLLTSPLGGTFEIKNTSFTFSEPVFDPIDLENGVYELMYYYEINGCSYETSQTFEINVLKKDDLFIPNVFTPNNDGLNDYFFADGLVYPLSRFELTIVNRAGSKVFQTTNHDFQWKGAGMSSGVYFWSLTYGNSCDTHELNGFVHLIR
ncbi:gliding motility-associated C-terminal domain-containing protein [Ekhidna lutea]|uniref:Gliding motility-associated C-terminal domain-containing protein n=2 Tax=Ekhidna lutea TaxID=447679 RepID=A0A239GZS6_EKHLU|nr:gliding motility-associated C-terminal domain-containing protein [Ekhidna lutea]SNS74709.1 gliding motility-associated C-terminal domain-containing protein [Ekhidna lutea]